MSKFLAVLALILVPLEVHALSFKDDFKRLDGQWVATDHGKLGASTWDASHVLVRDGHLILRHTVGEAMRGAELMRKTPVLYGTLSARIKSGDAGGVLSTLFLYGNVEGKTHEIDVLELFPDQPDAPNLTSYMDWAEADEYKPGPHYFHAQPAIESFDCWQWHTYTVRWKPESVTWLIDGKERAFTDKVVPFKPLNIMFNTWHPSSWAKVTPDHDSEQWVDWLQWQDLKVSTGR